ncbi:MAG: ATP-binding protein [Bacteroidaceae bacterium]|nr:ATP-binding protein [Bacteroidaceae bacterium]
MIERVLKNRVNSLLGGQKAIVIMGARQVGKSTLLKDLFANRQDVLWMNGDDQDVRNLFDNLSSTRAKAIIGKNNILIIDEAQRITDIGLKIKLFTDQVEGVQVIATGSSSFELANRLNEPLTGRKREFKMFPITFSEMVNHTSLLDELRMIPHRMVYGYYPEVVTNLGDEKNILKELADSYLYRDILSLDNISKPEKLVKLLQALALQIGEQVSYNEVGQLIGIDPKTVEKYVDVLEKSYVIFRLGSFSRNLRNELKNSRKIYFWDLGIRNAVIGNFSNIENRADVGALWENYVISERMKKKLYSDAFTNFWFWRTQQQKEVDLIEEEDGKMHAYEFKWNPKKANVKVPDSFAKAYPDATFDVITNENVEEFIM